MTIVTHTEVPTSPAIHRSAGRTVRIELLGGFRLLAGNDVVPVSGGSERLLAFVALHSQAVGRLLVAGTLWSDVSKDRAYATLRAALARLDRTGRTVLHVTPVALELAQGVPVDLRDARALAHRLLGPDPPVEADLSAAAIASLSLDLLPVWYEDWVLLEAEDWRQLRLHALDALVGGLTTARRYGDATAAAGAAVRADPLRESAHAALIRVHLAEGNQSEALRAFDRFSHLLQTDLGLAPTPQLRELVTDHLVVAHHGRRRGVSADSGLLRAPAS